MGFFWDDFVTKPHNTMYLNFLTVKLHRVICPLSVTAKKASASVYIKSKSLQLDLTIFSEAQCVFYVFVSN